MRARYARGDPLSITDPPDQSARSPRQTRANWAPTRNRDRSSAALMPVTCVISAMLLGRLLGLWPELERFVPRSRGSSRAGPRPCPVDDCPPADRWQSPDLPPSRNRRIRSSHRAVQAFPHRARGAAPAVVVVRRPCPPRVAHDSGSLRRRGVRSTASSRCTPARMRSPAPLRSDCWSKRNHPCERPAFSPSARWTVEC
jgi:hypothetical protein